MNGQQSNSFAAEDGVAELAEKGFISDRSARLQDRIAQAALSGLIHKVKLHLFAEFFD